jgi:hypothetical protein
MLDNAQRGCQGDIHRISYVYPSGKKIGQFSSRRLQFIPGYLTFFSQEFG